ncbi:MAG: hypothetical protein IJV07_04220 [Alphaproteobacteria bacterium]|nr:hypothetical protein [Alphaproteobacteria bacterium]
MKHKFGIRKTKMNIFWLFLAGLLVGVVIGLRQPMPSETAPQNQQKPIATESSK